MKLPGSCHISEAPKGAPSNAFVISCSSKKSAKEMMAYLEERLGAGNAAARGGKSSSKSPSKKDGSAKKSTSAKAKAAEGKTPYILAVVVVKMIESSMKRDGRRKAISNDISRAYAMATAARQKHGYIAKGSKALTAEGKAADEAKRKEDGKAKVDAVFDKLDRFLKQAKS